VDDRSWEPEEEKCENGFEGLRYADLKCLAAIISIYRDRWLRGLLSTPSILHLIIQKWTRKETVARAPNSRSTVDEEANVDVDVRLIDERRGAV
jgi:hypothetical protein